ncbi:hypothetical protein FA95DRAFT_556338 [Auriscalpium vulgare]|uniref:Uncharacterized protein n=1 Tax=Auriscalpium vulgare TaxID=40419 RepID=A0ACB8REH1_9AGAM|nr:hypothetical protein FA95DRAFT_556338 [Auriscalpium vulgare]
MYILGGIIRRQASRLPTAIHRPSPSLVFPGRQFVHTDRVPRSDCDSLPEPAPAQTWSSLQSYIIPGSGVEWFKYHDPDLPIYTALKVPAAADTPIRLQIDTSLATRLHAGLRTFFETTPRPMHPFSSQALPDTVIDKRDRHNHAYCKINGINCFLESAVCPLYESLGHPVPAIDTHFKRYPFPTSSEWESSFIVNGKTALIQEEISSFTSFLSHMSNMVDISSINAFQPLTGTPAVLAKVNGGAGIICYYPRRPSVLRPRAMLRS